jgi:hypothetical protein
MRHLGSLIAGIVAAPLCWLLLAFGQTASTQAFASAADTGTFRTSDLVRPLVFLAVAGIALGLIATLRISPVGPAVAGAALAGSYIALLVSPRRTLDAVSYTLRIAHQRADLSLPLVTGTALAVGALLLVALASAGRWRRWPTPGRPATGAEPDEPPALADGALGGTPWSTFGGGSTLTMPAAEEPATAGPASDLPVRTPATSWPQPAKGDETTESLPARGRSPWETPLRDTSANQ